MAMIHSADTANVSNAWLAAAIGSADPFPWQRALLRRLRDGDCPHALDIPTGLGKTAVMAIWLVARACGATLPRRLIYVVDRRAIVDQATDTAERLRSWVNQERRVAHALGLGERPLPISTLRGQHVDNREWLEDPSMPAIVVGTVDMIGSRLLFEGYRCSRKLRPYHAAMLGADTLIVLDEAHLVPAFEAMVRSAVDDESLKSCPQQRELVPPSRVISLSATGRTTRNTLQLDAADLDHEVVRRRLHATKRVRIAEPIGGDVLADQLARKAWDLTGDGLKALRVLVFVDSRKTAQDVCVAMEKLARGDGATAKISIHDPVLFVGGRRVEEREAAARELQRLGLIAGSESRADKAVFVIATSAGEVGVDLDADHAVLDLVEWERMVQRLGRVNRRGDGEADVWIVPQALDDKTKDALAKEERILAQRGSEDEADDAEDGDAEEEADEKPAKKLKRDERERVERWRRKEATQRAIRSLPSSGGAYDASPRAVTELRRAKPDLVEAASTPAPLHPELNRAVVQAWSMTSLAEHTGQPNIRPWLRGWVDEEPQTVVVWRTWLPNPRDAEAFFDAASVETAETLEAESTTVLEWLLKRVKHVVKIAEEARKVSKRDEDQESASEASGRPPLTFEDVTMFVLDDRPRGWTVAKLNTLDKRGRDDLFRDIAGETIVVDVRLGGLSEHGLLDPSEAKNATDVSESTRRLPFRVREVDALPSLTTDDNFRIEASFVSRTNDEGEPTDWLIVETDLSQPSTTADGRSTGREQLLDEHQACAQRHARAIGERVGLRPEHVNLLALAAVLHDEGKKAERWQRAFRAPKGMGFFGKTTRRPIQSILAGYRHELGSLIDAEKDPRVTALSPDDRDLVLHMIAAHHGFARPILRTDGCEGLPPSALVERARTIALRFARLEKHWGPWGLAWWETLLRAADQAASRENDDRGGKRG